MKNYNNYNIEKLQGKGLKLFTKVLENLSNGKLREVKIYQILLENEITTIKDIQNIKDEAIKKFLEDNELEVASVFLGMVDAFYEIAKVLNPKEEEEKLTLEDKITKGFKGFCELSDLIVKKTPEALALSEKATQTIQDDVASFSRHVKQREKEAFNMRLLSLYKKRINELTDESHELDEAINELETLGGLKSEMLTPTSRYMDLTLKKKIKGTLKEIETEQDTILFLKQSVREDAGLTEEEKTEVLKKIDNPKTNHDFLLNRWLGKKLKTQEKIGLRALRGIIYRQFLDKKIPDFEGWINIKLSKLYEMCGVPKRKDGAFLANETKKIREILINFRSNILVKDEKDRIIRVTSFIIDLMFKTTKVKIVKNGQEEEQIQHTQIEIKISNFLFAGTNEFKNCYWQDTSGYIRFTRRNKTDIGNDLFLYLEGYLSAKEKTKELNLTKIIDNFGISQRFKTHPTEIRKAIERALNDMKEQETLIKSWKLVEGKRGQAKYIFENLRHVKKEAEIIKLPTKRLKKGGKKQLAKTLH